MLKYSILIDQLEILKKKLDKTNELRKLSEKNNLSNLSDQLFEALNQRSSDILIATHFLLKITLIILTLVQLKKVYRELIK